jgi:hypothetical protein
MPKGDRSDMTMSTTPTSHAVKGVLIDPPLGVVTIDLRDDRVDMRFSNAQIESFPSSAVAFIGRDAQSVALNWGGTPIVFRCSNPGDVGRFSDRLEADADDHNHETIRAFRLGYGGQLAS